MQVSYAQRLEDYHLDLVFEGKRDGFYVDIGGGHPVADNVSFHFYLAGWQGIVFEPQEHLAALYPAIRPRDVVLRDLAGAEDGEVDFHVVDRLHGFSTTIEAHAIGAGQFGAGYSTIRRRIRRLSSVLREHNVGTIDFLKIDVEGAEASVLGGMDLTAHRPRVICIEAVEPGSMSEAWHAWEPSILDAGYHFAFWDELNRFYVAKEHADLAKRFPKTPGDWGVVKHLYEFGKAHSDPHHPDRALTERLIRGFLASLPERSAEELSALLERTAPKDGMEEGKALNNLVTGQLDTACPLPEINPLALLRSDSGRAALGRIAAQYDGGMID